MEIFESLSKPSPDPKMHSNGKMLKEVLSSGTIERQITLEKCKKHEPKMYQWFQIIEIIESTFGSCPVSR